MTIHDKPYASNSPIRVNRATSWALFKEKKLLLPDNFSLEVKQHAGIAKPFTALVICTVYAKSRKAPGLHIFFASKLYDVQSMQQTLFRGYIPAYHRGKHSDNLNPYHTSARYIRWGSIHKLQVAAHTGNSRFPIIDHLESISPPPEDYQIPPVFATDLLEGQEE